MAMGAYRQPLGDHGPVGGLLGSCQPAMYLTVASGAVLWVCDAHRDLVKQVLVHLFRVSVAVVLCETDAYLESTVPRGVGVRVGALNFEYG